MTTAEAAESGTVEDTTAAAQAAVSSQDDDKAFEAEAREMGWVPEAEFKGDRPPKVFKTAQQYIEDIPPYVKKLLAKQEAKFDDRVAKLEKVNARTVETLTKQHKQEIVDLTAARKQAVEDGDAKEVARISDELADKKANGPDKADVTDAEDIDAAFRKRNGWYGDDDDLTALAIRESDAISKAYTLKNSKPIPDNVLFEKVEARVKASADYKAKYPDRTAANGHAAVDGGGEVAGGPTRSDPLSKLGNAERAKAVEDMKKFPKQYPTKQSWLDAYNS